MLVVKSGWPSQVGPLASITTTAALPLSYIAAMRRSIRYPSTGSGLCSVNDCSPCTSIAGLKVPMTGEQRAGSGGDDDRKRRQDLLIDVRRVLGGEGEFAGRLRRRSPA